MHFARIAGDPFFVLVDQDFKKVLCDFNTKRQLLMKTADYAPNIRIVFVSFVQYSCLCLFECLGFGWVWTIAAKQVDTPTPRPIENGLGRCQTPFLTRTTRTTRTQTIVVQTWLYRKKDKKERNVSTRNANHKGVDGE
jgi:hypothetical protein